jgi:hypothetical protein
MKRLLLTALVLAAGCKDESPAPDVPDARRVDAPQADAAGDAAVECFLPTGNPPNCFQQDVCEPAQPTEFLNGCTDGQCIAFDNVARLPLYNNGTLPPLP